MPSFRRSPDQSQAKDRSAPTRIPSPTVSPNKPQPRTNPPPKTNRKSKPGQPLTSDGQVHPTARSKRSPNRTINRFCSSRSPDSTAPEIPRSRSGKSVFQQAASTGRQRLPQPPLQLHPTAQRNIRSPSQHSPPILLPGSLYSARQHPQPQPAPRQSHGQVHPTAQRSIRSPASTPTSHGQVHPTARSKRSPNRTINLFASLPHSTVPLPKYPRPIPEKARHTSCFGWAPAPTLQTHQANDRLP
jgi:hypothetical protein